MFANNLGETMIKSVVVVDHFFHMNCPKEFRTAKEINMNGERDTIHNQVMLQQAALALPRNSWLVEHTGMSLTELLGASCFTRLAWVDAWVG